MSVFCFCFDESNFLILTSNISESRLAFRQAVSAPEDYHQSDSRGARAVWGLAEYVVDLSP